MVDTGATISFVSSKLIPNLVPKPKVLKSELSIVMGNGSSQDSTQPPSNSLAMPQHLALASDVRELDKLYNMTADAIEVR